MELSKKIIGFVTAALVALYQPMAASALGITGSKPDSKISSNSISSLVNSIRIDKAKNSTRVEKLVKLYRSGNSSARKAVASFDCFNKEKIKKVVGKELKLAPGTSRTFCFDDGSRITYTNMLSGATNAPAHLDPIQPMTTYPTSPQTSRCLVGIYIGPVPIEAFGGAAYWQDYSRSSCHIISCWMYAGAVGCSISSEYAKIIENDVTDSTFEVHGDVDVMGVYGCTVDQIFYVDTGGIIGVEN